MTKPFRKALRHLLLLFLTLGSAVAVPAQQTGDKLLSALQEAKETGLSEATLKQLLALAYEKQFEPSGMANLLPVLAQCKRENLPLAPFLSKIEEGISKRIPAPQIEEVLRTRLEDYRFTRSLIDETVQLQGKEEPVAADSHVRLTETLYCGLSRENLAHLLGSFPSAPLAVVSRGAEALVSLMQLRFDPQLAERIVDTGMKQDYFAVEQRDFARIVAAAKKKGLPDDQIAAAALEVMTSRGSQSDFSSRLGITDQDGSRQGPQVEKNSSAERSPAGKTGSVAPTRNGDSDSREGHKVSSNSSGPGSVDGSEAVLTPNTLAISNPADSSEAGATPETAAVSDPANSSEAVLTPDRVNSSNTGESSELAPGSSAVRNSSCAKTPDMDKSSRSASESSTDKNPKTTKTSELPHATDSAKASVPVTDQSSMTGIISDTSNTSKNTDTSGTIKGSDPKLRSNANDSSVPVRDSSAGNSSGSNGNSDNYWSGSVEKEQQKKAKAIFTAAGTVTEIDPDALTLTLDIDKACRVPRDYGSTFAISRKARVSAESSELGRFDLDLEDIAVEGDYTKVIGKKLADGTCLINQLVLSLDAVEGSDNETSAVLDGSAPESTLFAAAGTVVALDLDGLTLTLAIDNANYVLGPQIGHEEPFGISTKVKLQTEGTEFGIYNLMLEDMVVGEDYVKVLGRKQVDGTYVVNHIVVCVDE